MAPQFGLKPVFGPVRLSIYPAICHAPFGGAGWQDWLGLWPRGFAPSVHCTDAQTPEAFVEPSVPILPPTQRSSGPPSVVMVVRSSATCMAGVAGFEPANAGIKTRCLAAWRHPNNLSACIQLLESGRAVYAPRDYTAPPGRNLVLDGLCLGLGLEAGEHAGPGAGQPGLRKIS